MRDFDAYVRAFATIVLGLSSTQPLQPVAWEDGVTLARVLVGEGVNLLGDQKAIAGVALVHCLMNGKVDDETLEQTALRRFHGYTAEVEVHNDDVLLAQIAAVLYPHHDITNGAKYCLSRMDVETHGLCVKKATLSLHDGAYGLYFFREWPGREGE